MVSFGRTFGSRHRLPGLRRELPVTTGSLLGAQFSASPESFAALDAALRWKSHINLRDSFMLAPKSKECPSRTYSNISLRVLQIAVKKSTTF